MISELNMYTCIVFREEPQYRRFRTTFRNLNKTKLNRLACCQNVFKATYQPNFVRKNDLLTFLADEALDIR